ncbi:MAG: hypothetical protein OQJ89_12090 [Kangiellaceae bacterium]|nr:hypothetical protein [Kangiellaceae bacterium]MCW9017700.1 hypothetical protein [Kangiellaceae bacterium]
MSIINPLQSRAKEQVDDPYLPPEAEIEKDAEKVDYDGKMYNAFAVSLATLFGSVLAAGLLIYANFDNYGKKTKGIVTIIFTIFATIVFLFASLFVSLGSTLVYILTNFVLAAVMMPLTMLLQGNLIEAHEENEKPFHSIFRAIGIGVVCMLGLGAILATAIAMFLGLANPY